MRLLTLVRHAKSSWDHPELNDFERPLNARGRRDAPLMAAKVANKLPSPQRLVSSPALRAITTAGYFAAALKVDIADVRLEPRIYEASEDTLLKLVRDLDEADEHVMLFGHNPGLSELTRLLAEDEFDELPTCAVAHLKLRVDSWKEAVPACARLLQYFYPKDPQF